MRIASFSSRPPAGSNIAVHRILKSECAIAMPDMVAFSSRIAGANTIFTIQKAVSNTTTPITLNIKWTTAARFAFFCVPTEEISAVTQVPIFWPMIIGIAAA